MKTLQECREQFAKQQGFASWEQAMSENDINKSWWHYGAITIYHKEYKNSFLSHVEATELSQQDKDLIKGVFYEWAAKQRE